MFGFRGYLLMEKKDSVCYEKFILMGLIIGMDVGVILSSIFFKQNFAIGILFGIGIGLPMGLASALMKRHYLSWKIKKDSNE